MATWLTVPSLRYILLLSLMSPLIFCSNKLLAQIPDDFSDAQEIVISNNNYGVGQFYSDTIQVNEGSLEGSEWLYNNEAAFARTFWFRFYLPTKRDLTLSVQEAPNPGLTLQSDYVGFGLFREPNGLPTIGDQPISQTEGLGDLQIIDCGGTTSLDPGTYYVQLFAHVLTDDELAFLSLNLDYPAPTSLDVMEYAHDFGTLDCTESVNFLWNCLSTESDSEWNDQLGNTPEEIAEHNKSAWMRFVTDEPVDVMSLRITSVNQHVPSGSPVGIRIFTGDVDAGDLSTATIAFDEIINTNAQEVRYTCALEGNTEYYVQVLGHYDYFASSTLTIRHLGEGVAEGLTPEDGFLNNSLGTITPSLPAVPAADTDHFSCESHHVEDDPCDTAISPDATITYEGYNFNLHLWYHFETNDFSNTKISTRIISDCCSDDLDHNSLIRIYQLPGAMECGAFSYPDDIYFEGVTNDLGWVKLFCLPPGSYAIQIFGIYATGNLPNCNNSEYGKSCRLTVEAEEVPPQEYGLAFDGDVDWINAGTPLMDDQEYQSDTTRFSCIKTLLPDDDSPWCDEDLDRAIYRQVVIDDAGGTSDGGLLTIDDFRYYEYDEDYQTGSVFYRGDANDLAVQQNVFDWPNLLGGLDPQAGCNTFEDYFEYWYNPNNYSINNRKKFCVSPGTYTLVTLGDSTQNGSPSYPSFRFDRTQTQYWDPQNPEDLGDIIAQNLSVTSETDYFSCLSNPAVIAGLDPCTNGSASFDKLIYREFYISEPCRLLIGSQSSSDPPGMYYRVFSGRVSDVGTAGLSLAPFHSSGCYYSDGGDYYTPDCATVPEGWYTVVCYGFGPSYDDNFEIHEDNIFNYQDELYSIDHSSIITVTADTTIPPGPFFNRPYKLCDANNGNPLSWVNTNSETIPSPWTSYPLCEERFKENTDNAHIAAYHDPCVGAERIAYYRFTTDSIYHLKITGIQNFYKKLYALDALTDDSLLFQSTTPIVNCGNQGNNIDICSLDPGTYTLIVFGTENQDCIEFTPSIHVQPVAVSRFDFIPNAYDFGVVPGDNTFYGGAVGDEHPEYPGTLLPSNDFFYCTTGASSYDPNVGCIGNNTDYVYPNVPNNDYYFDSATNENEEERRSLWYTFVLEGMGDAEVRIRNLTQQAAPSSPLPIVSIWYTDQLDGSLDYSDLIDEPGFIATIDDELEFVTDNTPTWNCGRTDLLSFSFISDFCIEDTTKRRYFVLVDLEEDNGSNSHDPIVQVDLQVKWNPIGASPEDPMYDFIDEANWVGNDEIIPPYAELPLEFEELEIGGWGNMTCASADASDAIFSCNGDDVQRSLWWKLKVEERGNVFIGLETNGMFSSGAYQRVLVEELVPGATVISDNGGTGLDNLGAGTSGSPGNTGAPGGLSWRRWCLEEGTYYYHVQRCDDLDTTEVRPYIYFTDLYGDFCSNAVSGQGDQVNQSYLLSAPIQCQTIGTDFGEDGSDMGCLPGPGEHQSTWFQFSYTGPDSVTVQFSPQNVSGWSPTQFSQVWFRVFYGEDCNSLVESSYCQQNSFVRECVTSSNGNFYVQVVYPDDFASGNIGFEFTVLDSDIEDCNPFDPYELTAFYSSQPNCEGDSVIFSNLCTSGVGFEYEWDFGFFGPDSLSTETNPIISFPSPGDYDVTVTVINSNTGDSEDYTETVTVSESGDPIDLPDSLVICEGSFVELGQSIPGALYDWSTGHNSSEIQVFDGGLYYLNYSLSGCDYSDTTLVELIDITTDLGPDTHVCIGDSLLLSPPIPELADTIMWTSPNWSEPNFTDLEVYTGEEGQVKILLSNEYCTFEDSVDISVVDLTFDLGEDETICIGESIELLAPNEVFSYNLNWSNNLQGASSSFSEEGWISLEAENLGCTFSDSLYLTLLDLSFDLLPDTNLCFGESIFIEPENLPVYSGLVWTGPNGYSSNNQQTEILEPGQYTVEIDSIGCSASNTVDISLMNLEFDLGENDTICSGESFIINPIVSPGVEFSWSTDESSPSIEVTETDTYYLTIDSLACFASDSIEIFRQDLLFAITPDTAICEESEVNLTITDPPSFEVNYEWSTGDLNNNIIVGSPGDYELSITDTSTGCGSSQSTEVSIHFVEADLEFENPICLNDSSFLTVANVDSLQWNTNEANTSQESPTSFWMTPNDTLTYQWTVFDWQCVASGELTVDVLFPHIPDLSDLDVLTCLNEELVPLPADPITTGVFLYGDTVFTEVEPLYLGLGEHVIIYDYVDDNNCPNQIDFSTAIVDTTFIAFTSSFDPMCLDSEPVELAPFVDVPGGVFTTSYNLTTPEVEDLVAFFSPDLIISSVDSPEAFPITYEYVNSDDCLTTIDTTVAVHPYPVIDITVSDICLYDSLFISNSSYSTGSEIESYSWQIETLGTYPIPEPAALVFSEADWYNYNLEVISSIGCSASMEDSLLVHPIPQSAYSWEGHCNNEVVSFESQAQIEFGSISETLWSSNDDQSSSGESTTLSFPKMGDYDVEMVSISDFGCRDSIENTISIYPAPSPGFVAENNCLEQTSIITPDATIEVGSIDSITYVVDGLFELSGLSSLDYTFEDPGTYSILQTTVSDTGCVSALEQDIVIYPLPEASYELERDLYCLNEQYELLSSSQVEEPHSIVETSWAVSDGNAGDGLTQSFPAATLGSFSINLVVETEVGCLDTLTEPLAIHVVDNPTSNFNVLPDTITHVNPFFDIIDASSSDAINYTYVFSDGRVFDTAELSSSFSAQGAYQITQLVENMFGCVDSSSRTVIMLEDYLVFIPNAFTPNDNEVNEVFKPVITGDKIYSYSFSIWNRWGEQIFLSTDPEEGWNGSVKKGEHYAPNGTYVYKLSFVGQNTEVYNKSGSVTLIR